MILSKKVLLYASLFCVGLAQASSKTVCRTRKNRQEVRIDCIRTIAPTMSYFDYTVAASQSISYPAASSTATHAAMPFMEIKSTDLHDAAKKNNPERLEQLIHEGVDIQALDKFGGTAVHQAAHSGNGPGLEIMLRHPRGKACLNIQNSSGRTPLHLAARLKSSDAILKILEYAPPSCIDIRDTQGSTALLWAASHGNVAAVAGLLEKGANPNMQDELKGRTALHWTLRMRISACMKNTDHMLPAEAQKILSLLLSYHADPTILDKEGKSAIDWTKGRRHLTKEYSMLQAGIQTE